MHRLGNRVQFAHVVTEAIDRDAEHAESLEPHDAANRAARPAHAAAALMVRLLLAVNPIDQFEHVDSRILEAALDPRQAIAHAAHLPATLTSSRSACGAPLSCRDRFHASRM